MCVCAVRSVVVCDIPAQSIQTSLGIRAMCVSECVCLCNSIYDRARRSDDARTFVRQYMCMHAPRALVFVCICVCPFMPGLSDRALAHVFESKFKVAHSRAIVGGAAPHWRLACTPTCAHERRRRRCRRTHMRPMCGGCHFASSTRERCNKTRTHMHMR